VGRRPAPPCQHPETFGARIAGPPRGGARALYSRYLLTGLLRCACGARMRAQTAVKRRQGRVYRAAWYRCAFAADKGPDPAHPLAAPSMSASKEKYPQYFSGNDISFRPFWAPRPTTAFAWTLEGFP
jgi:hypothetical protein